MYQTKMKRIVVSVLCALFVTAFAASAETVKVKARDLLNLQTALTSLDGHERVLEAAKDEPAKVAQVPYDLSGAARLAVAFDIAEVNSAITALNSARDGLIKEISGGKNSIPKEDEAAIAKFSEKFGEVLDAPVDLNLRIIAVADLKLDVNPIPGTVLAVLKPVLKE